MRVINVEIYESRDALMIVHAESIKAVHVCNSATSHEPAEQNLAHMPMEGGVEMA